MRLVLNWTLNVWHLICISTSSFIQITAIMQCAIIEQAMLLLLLLLLFCDISRVCLKFTSQLLERWLSQAWLSSRQKWITASGTIRDPNTSEHFVYGKLINFKVISRSFILYWSTTCRKVKGPVRCWSNLNYLKNYWLDWDEVCLRRSCSPQVVITCNNCGDPLTSHQVNILMCPVFWLMTKYLQSWWWSNDIPISLSCTLCWLLIS